MCFVRMSVNFLQIFRVICQKSYSVLVPKIICGGLLRIWLGYFSMLLGVKNNKWNNLQSFAIFQSVVICFFNFWSTPKMFKKSYQMTINYMATHSSTLAWKIPWMEQPGGLQSMGSRRVGHDWATSLSLFTFMHWRRKWQPTPAFLPGESQGGRSLVGCHLWGWTESDTTEAT